MTDDELKAITEGFKHLNERIADLEAKMNAEKDNEPKKEKIEDLNFDDLPDGLKEKEIDKSTKIKESWFDRPLY